MQKWFQSTLPRGKRLDILTSAVKSLLFQSTLPRGKRRKGNIVRVKQFSISIHASAREATGSSWKHPATIRHFNPRFREGSDIRNLRLHQIRSISIHASAREATANVYNFLVHICKNHSTTYKLIIIFLFHIVKQIKYSYWKTCESTRIFMCTCDSHLIFNNMHTCFPQLPKIW